MDKKAEINFPLTFSACYSILRINALIIKIFDLQSKLNADRKEIMKMLERVKEIMEEQFNLEDVEITEATRFKEDLNVDSLDLFELVMAFEEEYGVEIPSEELEGIITVGDVIAYMQNHGASVAD